VASKTDAVQKSSETVVSATGDRNGPTSGRIEVAGRRTFFVNPGGKDGAPLSVGAALNGAGEQKPFALGGAGQLESTTRSKNAWAIGSVQDAKSTRQNPYAPDPSLSKPSAIHNPYQTAKEAPAVAGGSAWSVSKPTQGSSNAYAPVETTTTRQSNLQRNGAEGNPYAPDANRPGALGMGNATSDAGSAASGSYAPAQEKTGPLEIGRDAASRAEADSGSKTGSQLVHESDLVGEAVQKLTPAEVGRMKVALDTYGKLSGGGVDSRIWQ